MFSFIYFGSKSIILVRNILLLIFNHIEPTLQSLKMFEIWNRCINTLKPLSVVFIWYNLCLATNLQWPLITSLFLQHDLYSRHSLFVFRFATNHHKGAFCMFIGTRSGRMVVRYTTTYAIGAYRHHICEFETRSRQGVLDKQYLIMFESYLWVVFSCFLHR
jgi:hypothetical protein